MERGKQRKTKTFRSDLNRHGLHTGQNDRGAYGDGATVADDVQSEPRRRDKPRSHQSAPETGVCAAVGTANRRTESEQDGSATKTLGIARGKRECLRHESLEEEGSVLRSRKLRGIVRGRGRGGGRGGISTGGGGKVALLACVSGIWNVEC
jgi:hypothetical protein